VENSNGRIRRFLSLDINIAAYSDEAGHLFRHEAGHRTDLKPAIIPG